MGMHTIDNQDAENLVRDSGAIRFAREALAGNMPERDARWNIAELLRKSGIVEQIVGRLQLSPQEARDMIPELYYLADDIVVGISGQPKLDLKRIADGASYCGWIRKFLSSLPARTCVQRPHWTRARREKLVSDQGEWEEVFNTSYGDIATSVIENDDRDTMDAATARFEKRAPGLRRCGKVHLTARTLATAFSLRQPPRAIDIDQRDRLLEIVKADEYAAYGALVFRPDTYSDPDTAALASIFADWTDEDKDTLLSQSPLVCQAYAIAALTPIPPPQASSVAKLKRNILQSGQRVIEANALVGAFVAAVSETTTSEFDAHHALEIKTVDERDRDRHHFEEVASQIIKSGWVRLGKTPHEVEENMRLLLDSSLAA